LEAWLGGLEVVIAPELEEEPLGRIPSHMDKFSNVPCVARRDVNSIMGRLRTPGKNGKVDSTRHLDTNKERRSGSRCIQNRDSLYERSDCDEEEDREWSSRIYIAHLDIFPGDESQHNTRPKAPCEAEHATAERAPLRFEKETPGTTYSCFPRTRVAQTLDLNQQTIRDACNRSEREGLTDAWPRTVSVTDCALARASLATAIQPLPARLTPHRRCIPIPWIRSIRVLI
jgi:hypothetical protein